MTIVPTRGGASYYQDIKGNYWRAYVFIERVNSSHVAEKPKQAEQVGRAFGLFQKRLADLPTDKIQETIYQYITLYMLDIMRNGNNHFSNLLNSLEYYKLHELPLYNSYHQHYP